MSHTTKFIVDTPDYFAAHTDAGTIRLGLTGVVAIEVGDSNSAYLELLACKTSDEVEAIFDALYR